MKIVYELMILAAKIFAAIALFEAICFLADGINGNVWTYGVIAIALLLFGILLRQECPAQ